MERVSQCFFFFFFYKQHLLLNLFTTSACYFWVNKPENSFLNNILNTCEGLFFAMAKCEVLCSCRSLCEESADGGPGLGAAVDRVIWDCHVSALNLFPANACGLLSLSEDCSPEPKCESAL